MNYKIRVTPEESRQIQEICFKKGIYWFGGQRSVLYTDGPFLFINQENFENNPSITYGDDELFFKFHNEEEISAKEFIKKYGGSIIDTLKVGDLLIDRDGDFRKVLAKVDGVVLISMCSSDKDDEELNMTRGWYTDYEFKQMDLSKYEDKVTEVTMDEVARKFNVPVSQLKIKKD